MKRELKFRAWHIDKKEMYWFDVIWGNHNQGSGYIGMVPFGEPQTKNRHRDNMILIDPENCEIMQFTGLEDKNGKEIYEGDICICREQTDETDENGYYLEEDVIGKVIYHDCSYWVKKPYSTSGIGENSDIKVIGNIHENPELIK